MIIDTLPGKLVIRDAESILGIVNDLHLTPHEAQVVAANLDSRCEHTTAAEGLRRAAARAEKLGKAI